MQARAEDRSLKVKVLEQIAAYLQHDNPPPANTLTGKIFDRLSLFQSGNTGRTRANKLNEELTGIDNPAEFLKRIVAILNNNELGTSKKLYARLRTCVLSHLDITDQMIRDKTGEFLRSYIRTNPQYIDVGMVTRQAEKALLEDAITKPQPLQDLGGPGQ